MSHFSVAVITETNPTENDLTKILQPWHEYECTGEDDEHVIFVPAEETVEQFKEQQTDWVKNHPEDANETLEVFINGYHGYRKNADGVYGRRTNPNAHWDWWVVGGRWSGHFQPHYDAAKDPNNQETCLLCRGTGNRPDMKVENGCNGCGGAGIRTKWPTQWDDVGNTLQIKDVPVDTIVSKAEQAAAKKYDDVANIINGRAFHIWEHVRDVLHKGNIAAARDYYHGQDVINDVRRFDAGCGVDEFLTDRKTYISTRGASSLSTFAVVKDGQWYERGSMGWWAMVSDEDQTWDEKFLKLFKSTDPEHWVTVIDCHI